MKMIEGARNDSRICLQILPIFRQIKNFREKILKFKKAHHKAKKNYNKYLNTKDEDKYRIVYTDKQALYESSTEEYTLQVEKFNQAQVRVTKPIYLRTVLVPVSQIALGNPIIAKKC